LFLELFPENVTLDVMTYIVYHDIAEIGTGDLPFPVKAHHPGLAEVLHEVEAEVLDNMGIVLPALSVQQRLQVKLCDLLEMYEWGQEEMKLGNSYAEPIVVDTRAAALDLASAGGQEIEDTILTFVGGTHD